MNPTTLEPASAATCGPGSGFQGCRRVQGLRVQLGNRVPGRPRASAAACGPGRGGRGGPAEGGAVAAAAGRAAGGMGAGGVGKGRGASTTPPGAIAWRPGRVVCLGRPPPPYPPPPSHHSAPLPPAQLCPTARPGWRNGPCRNDGRTALPQPPPSHPHHYAAARRPAAKWRGCPGSLKDLMEYHGTCRNTFSHTCGEGPGKGPPLPVSSRKEMAT